MIRGISSNPKKFVLGALKNNVHYCKPSALIVSLEHFSPLDLGSREV